MKAKSYKEMLEDILEEIHKLPLNSSQTKTELIYKIEKNLLDNEIEEVFTTQFSFLERSKDYNDFIERLKITFDMDNIVKFVSKFNYKDDFIRLIEINSNEVVYIYQYVNNRISDIQRPLFDAFDLNEIDDKVDNFKCGMTKEVPFDEFINYIEEEDE